ncbi:MAG: TauD/TfdA family dioxygenase [Pseudomonadota bacterium]
MLDFESDYPEWRQEKLDFWPTAKTLGVVSIQDPESLTFDELEQLKALCEKINFAIYRLEEPDLASKSSIRALGKQISMDDLDQNLCADEDSVSSLRVMNFSLGSARGYIPYTTNMLNWHTDGYYNEQSKHIRSFLLHCINRAESGGINIFINHELIYIHLYDRDPLLVTALMQNDVMTIPANTNPDEIRPAQTGPVFYRDPQTKALQMRYTARTRSIIWKDDPLVNEATSIIEELLADNRFVLRHALSAGEGFVCNNILHGRSSFINGNIPEKQRLLYRIRSYNRLFS